MYLLRRYRKNIANDKIHLDIHNLLFIETVQMEIRGTNIPHESHKMTYKRELENEINHIEIQDKFEVASTLLLKGQKL